ncbi:YceI family protein [Micromonospora endophytica]|uniref:Polyisoprenoid-binding protein n=1 Tax=Micromonospora endophytica TaxID=515350 RepID=A0A2W2CD26_9ACTN|nr:YceI family protein [Micromonospora endophytica]PZF97241.1 polyisoprenoid-binding protein [Micromonospora endophytica]RIW51425.1 YceI family protein [Micromonospora endophytica]BCJ62140.1 polyisoprenoid-binding protein [Micromonospora endophytica]
MTGSTRTWNGVEIPAAGLYQLDPAHKRVGFVARHMMVSPVRGEFRETSAYLLVAEDPLRSSIRATIQADSIDTANADRDAHLRSVDFLDTERFPALHYRSTGIALAEKADPIFYWAKLRNHRLGRRAAPAEASPSKDPMIGRFVLTGELTVKGITRAVDLRVEFGGARRDPEGRDIFGFSATGEINREEYGLLWNVALESGGVLVGKNIRIEIAGEAIRQR